MDRPSPSPLVVPRLRLNRQPPSFTHSESNDTSHTGSSRLPEVTQLIDMEFSGLNNATSLSTSAYPIDEEQGQVPTPRVRPTLPPSTSHADTPAERLRALLALVPNHSKPSISKSPPSHPPSEFESDYEPPEPVPDTPSVARESLRDIFSRALRNPGDTPKKGNRRRNSIDLSEVEGSPINRKIEGRADIPRRSLSDEETDNQPARSSFLHDTVRRPVRRKEDHQNQSRADSKFDESSLNPSFATPPAASSTPQDSLRMSQAQFHSNLLDQDSDMQRAIDDLNSSNGELSPGRMQKESKVVFPDWARKDDNAPVHESSSSRRSFETPVPSAKREIRVSDQSSSVNNKNLESERNKRKPLAQSSIPELKARHSLSRLSCDGASSTSSSRRESITSLHSNGSENGDRDHTNVSRTTSTTKQQSSERVRTKSLTHHPSRPDSAQSTSSFTSAASLRRHSSRGSVRSNTSGGSSVNSLENGSVDADLTHLRERNWNAPRPTWSQSSKLPTSRPYNHIHSPASRSPQQSFSKTRTRAESLNDKSNSPNGFYNGSPDSSHSRVQSPALSLGEPQNDTRRRTPSLPAYTTDVSSRGAQGSTFDSGLLRNRPILSSFSSGSKMPVSTSPRASKPSTFSPSSTRPTLSVKRHSGIPIRSPKKVETNDSDDDNPLIKSVDQGTPATDQQQDSVGGLLVHSPAPADERTPTLKLLPTLEDTPQESSISGNETNESQHESTLSPTEIDKDVPPPDAEVAILSTPPRKNPSNTSKIEYKTPSPPKGLPELPGPPSSSEDEEVQSRPRSDSNNWTAINTPRPPGDFFKPFAPNVGSMADVGEASNGEVSGLNPNSTLFKTPRPPGAWTATPASNLHRDNHYQLSQESQESDGAGLATPIPLMSKGAFSVLNTPAPPGAWAPTPATRKSILKVRFDSHQSVGESNDPADNTISPNPNGEAEESAAPIESVPPARSPRKPAIRVLDAYGHETVSDVAKQGRLEDTTSSKNRTSIRIVDAMGREVEEQVMDSTNSNDPPLSSDRSEALSRVRRGLDDLVNEIAELDKSDDGLVDEGARIEELNRVSRETREARERTALKMYAREEELKRKLASSQKDARRSSPNERYFFFTGWKLFIFFLLLQVLLCGVMYRATILRVKEIFLTTYYDPFYPDLYIYDAKHGARLLMPAPKTSWRSLPGVLFHEGWKPCGRKMREKVVQTVFVWQRYLWEVWGEGAVYGKGSWPPT